VKPLSPRLRLALERCAPLLLLIAPLAAFADRLVL